MTQCLVSQTARAVRATLVAMSPSDLLQVHTHNDDPGLIDAIGQIDAHTAPHLHEVIATVRAASTPATSIRLNLSGITFIDSSGLRVLVRAHNKGREDGLPLQIVDPSQSVRRLLTITGLSGELEIVES